MEMRVTQDENKQSCKILIWVKVMGECEMRNDVRLCAINFHLFVAFGNLKLWAFGHERFGRTMFRFQKLSKHFGQETEDDLIEIRSVLSFCGLSPLKVNQLSSRFRKLFNESKFPMIVKAFYSIRHLSFQKQRERKKILDF